MKRRLVLAFAVLALLATSTGSHASVPPSEIEYILVEVSQCLPVCEMQMMSVKPDDAGTFERHGDVESEDLALPAGTFARLAAKLAATSFFDAGSAPGPPPMGPGTGTLPFGSTFLTAGRGGASATLAFELHPGVRSEGDVAVEEGVAFEAMSAVRSAEFALAKKSYDRLSAYDRLAAVELRADGCYGSSPSYDVEFSAGGKATIDARNRCGQKVRSTALVRFDVVKRALMAANAAALRTKYPLLMTDAFAASIVLRYDAYTFRSDGPDRNGWGAPFSATFDRLDQLVLDAPWVPPLPDRFARESAGPGSCGRSDR